MGIIQEISSAKIEHPLFDASGCLNKKQNKYTCTACMDVCPEKVFSLNPKEALKWDKCSDCGICTTSCPSRCFTPSAAAQQELIANVQADEPVIYGCDEDEEILERKLTCLASVPWELAAALAFYTDVVFLARNCKSCPQEDKKALLAENLAQIKNFLGDRLFEERIHIVEEGDWVPKKKAEKLFGRRDIISGVLKSVVKSAYKVAAASIPMPVESEKDGMQFRRMLSNAVLKAREREKNEGQQPSTYQIELPRINAGCYGCNICERICPQKAFETGPEENGSRLIYITPWKCTACGLCMLVCPNEGIAGIQAVSVPYLEKLPLVRVKTASCEKCGAALKPGTEPLLCPSCKMKAKKKLR